VVFTTAYKVKFHMFKHRIIFEQIKPYFETPEAIVITGMRRTGKTTLLKYIFDNINSEKMLMLKEMLG